MKSNIVLWLIVLVCYSANGQTPSETVAIVDEMSVTRNGIPVMDIQTSLASYKGCLYFGYVDKSLQMCITKKDLNGNVTTSVVATNVLEDPHNGVSIGIDQEGYIHFTGNMHQDKMQYWRSNKAEDISSFKMLHGDMAIGGLNGPNGVSYGRFIQSRKERSSILADSGCVLLLKVGYRGIWEEACRFIIQTPAFGSKWDQPATPSRVTKGRLSMVALMRHMQRKWYFGTIQAQAFHR